VLLHTGPTRHWWPYEPEFRLRVVDESEGDISEVELVNAIPAIDPDPFSLQGVIDGDQDSVPSNAAARGHLACLKRSWVTRFLKPARKRERRRCVQSRRWGVSLSHATARLGRLLDHYGAAEMDAALTDVIARGALSTESVAHVLDQRARARRSAPPLDVPLPDDPRIRDLRVTPHGLAGYDRLSAPDTEDDDGPR